MDHIICKNDLETIVNKLQDYAQEGHNIQGIKLVDKTENQVVILVHDEPISQIVADIWWSGFRAAIE